MTTQLGLIISAIRKEQMRKGVDCVLLEIIYEKVEKMVEEKNLTHKYKMDTLRNSIRGRLNTHEIESKDPNSEKLFVRQERGCYSLTEKGERYAG